MNDGKGHREEFIRRIFDDRHIEFTYKLEHDREMLPGPWRLQIATLDDVILVDESFTAGN